MLSSCAFQRRHMHCVLITLLGILLKNTAAEDYLPAAFAPVTLRVETCCVQSLYVHEACIICIVRNVFREEEKILTETTYFALHAPSNKEWGPHLQPMSG
jgi:hypothetical protein